MTQQTIIAHFDSRSDAQQAVEALTEAGISRSAIRLVPEAETGYQRTDQHSSYDRNKDEGGFWASLSDFFLPDEDRYSYAEGMSRGGATLAVNTDEAQVERVAGLLERNGAVDMEEREDTWRSEGWTGYTAGSTGSVSAGTQTIASAAATDVRANTRAGTDDTEVIPIAEEQLRVGKRQVNQGRVRVRSYVVETPVSEQVNLREEHVHVERRPVDRALTGDENLFQERTIEAEERAEEAVVSKETRVKEELVIRKDVGERTETVSDTVRRTEVDVEDERGARDAEASKTSSANDRGRG
jgi:uncharacterized protein (TIGR02271 family)